MRVVMIVDDEPLLRAAIANAVEWEKLGFGAVIEASNGTEALALAKEHRPDFILTDVIMPGMNGIELIRQVRQLDLNCKVVVLSGHDDYPFVREALLLGAQDYLLKSEVGGDKLRAVVDKVCALDGGVEGTAPKAGGDWDAWRIFDPETAPAQRRELFARLELSEDAESLVVASVFMIQYAEIHSRYPQSDLKALIQAVEDVFSENCPKQRWIYRGDGVFSCVFSCGAGRAHLAEADEVLIGRMVDIMERLFNTSFSAGISLAALGEAALPELARQAETCVEEQFYQPEQKVWRQEGLVPFAAVRDLEQRGKKMIHQIRNETNARKPAELCEDIIGQWRSLRSKHYCPRELRRVCADLIGFASSFMLADDPDALGFRMDHVIRSAQKCLTWKELEEYVINCLRYLVNEHANSVGRTLMSEHIERAVDFINKNYARDDLSLQLVADAVNVNSSYLSRLFNQKLKRNYTQYIADLRVRKASELLLCSRMSVEEVSSSVGYKNAKHFCSVFKAVQGVSPSQFRKVTYHKCVVISGWNVKIAPVCVMAACFGRSHVALQ